ncbi:MAG: mycoredoxin-dependent peroxiredoxin [Chloroflexota bacterium]|jgi:peroxiredoxin|nr:mycoredoxin-dependent peroxiredoxin [Chloroflexota bacterium]
MSTSTAALAVGVEVGQEAPDFTLRDDQNQKWTLSAHRGRNVLLVFYPLSFSGVCTKELHELRDRSSEFADAAEVVGISVDSKYVQAAFKRDDNLPVTLLADFQPRGAVARLYGVFLEEWGYAGRGTFVIDKNGRVAAKVVAEVGQMRDPDEYLSALARCPV